ncbi:inositol polyphosphate 5-phosphatase OCRL-1-like [Orbicella faveolata]|uniref:inositol polyphosphate 5-phosphatase OCRL-1-like n=1 Tax=Orbicella faveolata TaxID=48498 RepID=UPI0009E4EA7C|nr:inositol polyphosphate 5-phosphatase OCRL-1-like [Orbicella faveolata]
MGESSFQEKYLEVLYVLAIRGPFSYATVADQPADESNDKEGVVRFQILTDDQTKLVFELKKDTQGKNFLVELNKAIGAYRQRAHMVGVPEFKWLEKYQQLIGRKSFISVDGWPWDHLEVASSSGSEVVTASESKPDDASLDVFGMPGFSPSPTIHPSLSSASLTASDEVDKGSTDSPALPRRSILPTSVSARDGFIKLHMATRESEYTHIKKLKIFVGTWNVNGQTPAENVAPWLAVDRDPPDVFSLGFQELDLSAETLLKNVTPKEDEWLKIAERGLHPKAQYIKVKTIRLVGILLMVFVKSQYQHYVTEVDAETVATGIMGLMGNKGGVAIRMQIHNTSICFVNSHLAAHTEEFERRNQDYRDILSKLEFNGSYGSFSITDHEAVFWLGDLNYRISGMDTDLVRRLADKGQYEELLANDQLIKEQKEKKCFKGFKEGSIKFKPTYKYDPGTDNWDTSEKGRAPAWCDRILWTGSQVNQLEYRSHNKLKISDHKPVSALFEVGVRVVNVEQERQVMEDVIRKLDRKENENLPQVQLGTTEIIFKDVQFLEKQTATLEIVNTGQVPARFAFVAKLDDTEYCKPWLTVKPCMGIITTGGTKHVRLTVYVDKESSRTMNSGDEKLEDILVLHLEGGKDFFVSVSGNYLPSVFGSSIEALVRMYGPIREVPVATLVNLEHIDSSNPSASPDSHPLEIPKELWLLTDHLFNFGMRQENILRQSGFERDLEAIRTHLDCCRGGKLPGSIYSVAEALLIFLEALPEPVIPYAFYQRALECCNNYMLCKQLIFQMPQSHQNVFTYISSFLRELLLHSNDNKLDAKTLATLFGTLFLRAPKKKEAGLSKRNVNQLTQKKARFMYHFLVNEFGPD